MCGIAGVWHKKAKVNLNDVESFKKSLFHRGPDVQQHQLFDEGRGALVHTRLSIIDLSEEANQPFVSDCGNYMIVFNGEIFNYLELREELEELGESFRTKSDTEVLLKAFIKWGEDCLHKFNGMWAFAIYNMALKTLFLARDRYGIKPLYFVSDSDYFAFASETVSFNKLSFFNKKLNTEYLEIAKQYGDKLEGLGLTIYENLYQLMPGHACWVNETLDLKVYRWYNIFNRVKKFKGSYEEAVKRFKYLFTDACKLRLRSDVPTATALSGGVDSTAVYCTIQQLLEEQRGAEQLRTAFTVSFPGQPQDETEIAKQTVKEKGGKHILAINDSEVADDDLTHSVNRVDTLTTGSILALMNLYGAMKANGITVSMDGHGADELMYGYRHQVSDLFHRLLREGLKKSELIALAKVLGGMREERVQNDYLNLIKQHFKPLKNKLRRIFKPIQQVDDDIKLKYGHRYNFSKLKSTDQYLFYDFFEYTLPNILRDFDRASMTHAVEIRMPFMDYRIVEFLFSLPFDFKVSKEGFTKRILRDAMKGVAPEKVMLRKTKIGVTTPLKSKHSWKEISQQVITHHY